MDTVKSVEYALTILLKLKKEKSLDIKDLGELLSRSEKECKRYLNTLNKMGIKIVKDNKKYKLMDNDFFINQITIDDDIIKSLVLCKDLLKKNGIHIYADKIEKLVGEIKNLKNFNENVFDDSLLLKGSEEEIKDEKVMEIYKKIQWAMDESFVVSIDYVGATGKESRRWIHPIRFVSNEGSIYVKAFCTEKDDNRDFKLIRIENAIVTSKKFDKNKYDLDKLDKSLGFINNGEIYNLKLKIKRPIAATIYEKFWIDNEKKYWENDCLIYEAQLRGDIEIIKWILTMKDCVTILEPLELREKVKETLENMMKNI